MKKFKFRYAAVLKIREEAEERVATELGELNFQLNNLKADFRRNAALQRSYEDRVEQALRSGDGSIDLSSIDRSKAYYRRIKTDLESKIEEKLTEIDAKKAELAEAMKDRKIMEKLKENQFEEYIEMHNKAEEKAVEEIVNFKNSKRGIYGDE